MADKLGKKRRTHTGSAASAAYPKVRSFLGPAPWMGSLITNKRDATGLL